jgi:hypothetical protein
VRLNFINFFLILPMCAPGATRRTWDRRSSRDAGDSKLLGLKFTDKVRRQALPLVSGVLMKVAAEKGSPGS